MTRLSRPTPLLQTEMRSGQGLISVPVASSIDALAAIAPERASAVLRSVLDQMPVGVLITDAATGKLLFANHHMTSIFRPAREWTELADYVGAAAFRPDGSRYNPAERPLSRTVRDGETVHDEELRIGRGDGTWAWLLVSSAPVHDASGAIVAAVGVYVDITERRVHEVLREAYLDVVSHELRTPMTSLIAASRLLAASPGLGEREQDLVGDLVAESDRLARIVDDLLVIARLERGVDLRTSEPILLQRLIPKILDAERRRWPQAEVIAEVPESLPAVRGDAGYLEQVLGNLLSNAAKYAAAGGPIEVVAAVDEESVAVLVLDRGPGIDAEPIEAVFDLFYRSRSAKSVAAGAGIGLFVARHLVQAMDGSIWARSREGGGTEFGFRLHVVPDSDAHLDVGGADAPRHHSALRDGGASHGR